MTCQNCANKGPVVHAYNKMYCRFCYFMAYAQEVHKIEKEIDQLGFSRDLKEVLKKMVRLTCNTFLGGTDNESRKH